jgi:hypothetical protein
VNRSQVASQVDKKPSTGAAVCAREQPSGFRRKRRVGTSPTTDDSSGLVKTDWAGETLQDAVKRPTAPHGCLPA